ncbi:TonB-dependent receptor [uncultured Alloprevotella sp.]|uniref:TonB-dependent receptor n=1 Tax=uncultured Alloprevotella sp. TaxID=1283315 RepID=UPI00262CEC3B|nr:TonB-dependent receptor [uncultured Alloprevotella sp.]
MQRHLLLLYILAFISIIAKADKRVLTGYTYSNGEVLSGTHITIKHKEGDNQIIAHTISGNDGHFILQNIPRKQLWITCSHVGYADYETEVHMEQQDTLDLGILQLRSYDHSLKEVCIVAERVKYSLNKQIIYPSKEQLKTSGSAYDILQKLPIPLLYVNPILRNIISLDPSGDIQIRINDIVASDNDLATLNPLDIKRIEIIRHPGMRYGTDLALVVNVIIQRSNTKLSAGGNLSNALLLTNGSNNLYGTYNRKHAQLVFSQIENYQFFKHFSTDEKRTYIMPTGNYHHLHIQDLSAIHQALTHGTTIKYNLSIENKFVFQTQVSLNLHNNPKQSATQMIEEDGLANYSTAKYTKDTYYSPSINLYLKKHMPQQREMIFNVVGTYINSSYAYIYEQSKQQRYDYAVKGNKYSLISEMRFNKNWTNYVFAAGIRNDISYTSNKYTDLNKSITTMHNTNTNLFLQLDAQWKKFTSRISIGASHLYYSQDQFKYHRLNFRPDIALYYSLSPRFNLGYNFILRPELPNLSYQNNAIIQLDKWERRIGNPNLKPYNHIENSLSISYNNKRLYLYSSITYANNKNAIMPTTYRTTQPNGETYFDTMMGNQPSMNQINVLTYLRYKLLEDKLILRGNGGFNHFYANGKTYTNHKNSLYGDFTIESYLGKWYLSGNISSRYIATFAETTWFNEYASSLSATYNHRNIQIGLLWTFPLQKEGCNSKQITNNAVIYKRQITVNRDKSNLFMVNFIWRWNTGDKVQAKEIDIDNQDTNAGVLK